MVSNPQQPSQSKQNHGTDRPDSNKLREQVFSRINVGNRVLSWLGHDGGRRAFSFLKELFDRLANHDFGAELWERKGFSF